MSAQTPSVSVIVVTYRRAGQLATCLEHLGRQTRPPEEILVVDASPDNETSEMLATRFPEVVSLRNPAGLGTMATSRAIGLDHARGEIIAYVDDDAYADPDWLAELVLPYEDPGVGGVGGRATVPGVTPAAVGPEEIGRLGTDGRLSGNFDVDVGAPVEVDHLLGANMSHRRDALLALGGIRDGFPGTCLREETDIALRLRRAGWRLVYQPRAHVLHVPGRYAKGRRFDLRYHYYACRNDMVLLLWNFGWRSPLPWRATRATLTADVRRFAGALRGDPTARHPTQTPPRALLSAGARLGLGVAGTVAGTTAGLRPPPKTTPGAGNLSPLDHTSGDITGPTARPDSI